MSAIIDQVLTDQATDLMFTFHTEAISRHGLKVRSFTVKDSVSEIYSIEIELVSERHDLKLDKLLGTPARLTVHDRYSKPVHYHGLIEEIRRGNSGHFRTFYRVRLMPTLHLSRHRTNCRIFQNQNIKQITETLLGEIGVSSYHIEMNENHPTREFCVQYRESDYDFMRRLWAEEGTHFHHEHSENGHKLILSDTSLFAKDVPVTPALEFNPVPGGSVKGPYIDTLEWVEAVQPRRVTLRDHSFQNPTYSYEQKYDAIKPFGTPASLEHYDYPGRHKSDEVGKKHAQFRLEYFRTEASYGEGTGRCPHLTAGKKLKITEHPLDEINRRYFLVAVTHHGTQPTALEDEVLDQADPAITGKPEGAVLTTAFHVIHSTTPYRPHQLVKPVVDGPQMGIVVGPKSEVIHTDEHSRVKVQFPWDREGKSDDNSSCWIRVSMNSGGATWGNVAIPRVGHHVVVSFLEGDPDQPLITGRAYHTTNKTPYPLPAHKTKTVLMRSDTHKGTGYNEMTMEDENGGERMHFHAQKDHTMRVGNNSTQHVESNAVQNVGANQSLEVGSNMQHNVGGGLSQVVGATTAAGGPSAIMTPALSSLMSQTGSMVSAAAPMVTSALAAAAGSGMSGLASAAAGALGGAASSALGGAASSALGGAASSAMGSAMGAASNAAGGMLGNTFVAAAGGAASGAMGAVGAAAAGAVGNAAAAGLGGLMGGGAGAASAAPAVGASPAAGGGNPAAMASTIASPSVSAPSDPSAGAAAPSAASDPASAAQGAGGAPSGASNPLSGAMSGLASAAGGALAGPAIAQVGQSLSGAASSLASGNLINMNPQDAAAAAQKISSNQGMSGDAGAAVSAAGGAMGGIVGNLIGQGIHSTLVQHAQHTAVGQVQTEMVGHVKTVAVGNVFVEQVGNVKKISIGDELIVEVGAKPGQPAVPAKDGKPAQPEVKPTPPKSFFVMKGDGTIMLKGVKIYVDGENLIQHTSKLIHHN